jgi:hypothetical protein
VERFSAVADDDWFKKNPPAIFIADVTFETVGSTGKPFVFFSESEIMSLNYFVSGDHLICGLSNVEGLNRVESGKKYRVRLRLPTAAAYNYKPRVGDSVVLTVGGKNVVAKGWVNLVE